LLLHHDWSPEKIKFFTIPQALICVKESEKSSISASRFKKSVKFSSKAQANAWLEKQVEK